MAPSGPSVWDLVKTEEDHGISIPCLDLQVTEGPEGVIAPSLSLSGTIIFTQYFLVAHTFIKLLLF